MENGKKKSILVVDNSLVILKLITNILEREGHSVTTAENGLEALEILESHTPDVIVTDLIMPKISGDIFCQIIRSRPEFDDVLLVVLSAVAAEEEVDYEAFGADICIAKGPAKKMSQHVLDVIKHYKARDNRQEKGLILGMDGVFKREITAELLSAKRHFEITLEHMTDGFIEMTTTAQIIYANKRAVQFFKQKKEQLLSSVFYDHFKKNLRSRLIECIQGLKSTPVGIGEDETLTINGLRVLMKFIPVREEDQQSIIVLIRDISRRKELEQQITDHLSHLEETIALRTREYLNINKLLHQEIKKHTAAHQELTRVVRQFEAVLDTSKDLIAVLDRDMKILRVNEALLKAYRLQSTAFIGKHCDILVHKDAAHSESWPHMVASSENKKISQRIENYLPGRTMYGVRANSSGGSLRPSLQ